MQDSATRPWLGLYNAYDGGLKAVHIQALARAAPLAAAYGFDLMLIGFPVDSLASLVAQVERETQIGEGRKWLTRLVSEGRVQLIPRDRHVQPYTWGCEVVALEQDAEPAKAVDLRTLLAGPQRVCLVMGLGSRGLPPQLLRAAKHHLELTGTNVPLETATVMGIVAERLRALRA